MKILYVTDQIHTHGGIEKILSAKLSYLAEYTEHEVFLLTGEQKGLPFVYQVSEKVNHIDLDINYNRTQSYFSKANLKIVWRHFHALKNKIRSISPDIIISTGITPDHMMIPLVANGIPTIKEIHFSGVTLTNNLLMKFFKRFLKKYSVVAVLNKDEALFYKEYNRVIIPNFTENILDGDLTRENVVIAAGRISAVKRFSDLIDIWSRLGKARQNWKLKIYGDGDLDACYEILHGIEKYNLTEEVFLLPATDNLQQELLRSKIYAMTSKTECFPMVLLEAQTAGLPVISYDCPYGPRNIINHNVSGILVDNGNLVQFAVELQKLMEDEERQSLLGGNAKINSKNYTPEIIMKEWMVLFNELKNNV